MDMATLRPVMAIDMVILETNYSHGYGYTGHSYRYGYIEASYSYLYGYTGDQLQPWIWLYWRLIIAIDMVTLR